MGGTQNFNTQNFVSKRTVINPNITAINLIILHEALIINPIIGNLLKDINSHMDTKSIISNLKSQTNLKNVQGMARFGINSLRPRAMGERRD